jgi:hypothetical protein
MRPGRGASLSASTMRRQNGAGDGANAGLRQPLAKMGFSAHLSFRQNPFSRFEKRGKKEVTNQ